MSQQVVFSLPASLTMTLRELGLLSAAAESVLSDASLPTFVQGDLAGFTTSALPRAGHV